MSFERDWVILLAMVFAFVVVYGGGMLIVHLLTSRRVRAAVFGAGLIGAVFLLIASFPTVGLIVAALTAITLLIVH